MPYSIERDGDQHCVVNSNTGERVKCHDTADEAEAHMRALYANVEDASMKAGRKISRANMTRIQQIADHAYAMGARPPAPDSTPLGKADMSLSDRTIAVHRAVDIATQMQTTAYAYVEEIYDAYVILCVGDVYHQAAYTMDADGAVTLAARDSWVEVEEVWQPVSSSAKAGGIPDGAEAPDIAATMKAAGDRQIDVRIAFGNARSKDNHGEYFSKNTDLAESDFPNPPLIYYHGFDQRSNKAMSKPVVIGKSIKRWSADDGHYIRYQLKSNQWADQTWDDACKGDVPASPGTVGYLTRKARDGELLYWPIAEVSAWDRAGGRKQAYRHTVATAALKALYIAEGLALPAPLDTTPPEAAGDAASAGEQISPEDAGRAIAAEVAKALLALRKEQHP